MGFQRDAEFLGGASGSALNAGIFPCLRVAGFIVELSSIVNPRVAFRSTEPTENSALAKASSRAHVSSATKGSDIDAMQDALYDRQDRVPSRTGHLPDIPVIETGRNFPIATLIAFQDRTHALLNLASQSYPVSMLKALDSVSRAWLARWNNEHLSEIDEIARVLGRPGAYFFSVNYEWACTCRAAPAPGGQSARLIRVLDWRARGLGANLVCAKVKGAPAGPFALVTWPGYSGVLQVMAPGRFSAALNQAPMRKATGLFYVDWVANRRRVWSMPHQTAAQLLRKVSEEARDFGHARQLLSDRPISAPAIFTLAGVEARETVIIERTEREARVREGACVAANHWESSGWDGHPRGDNSAGRSRAMSGIAPELDASFPWLVPPIRNPFTRLAMVADASAARLVAQGFEAGGPATAALDLSWREAL